MRLTDRSAPLSSSPTYYHAFGLAGERIAFDFLRQRGYEIVDEHVTARVGEIDLIARDKGEYVFVEVKTRRSTEFGEPEYAITPYKLQRLRRAIARYVLRNGLSDLPYRLDCICIMISGYRADIRHYLGCG